MTPEDLGMILKTVLGEEAMKKLEDLKSFYEREAEDSRSKGSSGDYYDEKVELLDRVLNC